MAVRTGTLLVTLLLLASIPALAWADSGATAPQGAASVGEISGTVRGPEGLPVPGADVTVEGESLIQAQIGAVSGINGGFRFRNLRPGTYTVTVNLQGFQTVEYEVGNFYDPAFTMVCKMSKDVLASIGAERQPN